MAQFDWGNFSNDNLNKSNENFDINQLMKFAQQLQGGNPQMLVEQYMKQNNISQEQFNSVAQKAKQLMGFLGIK